MRKILVVNVNWLGDVIFSSPVFRALRQHDPDAHIACMAVPRVKEILECVDAIDEIIEYDEEGRHKGLLGKAMFVGALRKKKFDEAFFLSRSFSRVSLAALAGIPRRIGYDHKNRGKLLTHVIAPPLQDLHRSDYYLNVVRSYGIPVNDPKTILTVPREEQNDIEGLLKSNGINAGDYVIALNPGGNWDLKRWPAENFTRLIDALNQTMQVKLLMTGSEKDRELVERICSACKTLPRPAVLTGKMTIKQLLALMKRIHMFISADSGPLHMASSVGCAAVGIFGPTRPEVTGPRGSNGCMILQKEVGCNKKACYHLECQDNICMQATTAQDVYAAVRYIKNS